MLLYRLPGKWAAPNKLPKHYYFLKGSGRSKIGRTPLVKILKAFVSYLGVCTTQ